MSRRSQLEHEVSLAQKRIKEAPQNTPANIREIWEQELVELEVEPVSYTHLTLPTT